MSLPALRAVRDRSPAARISVLARPSVADLYAREGFELIPYTATRGWRGIGQQWAAARSLRARRFDCAILFQNAFEAAALARAARIPDRIGYDRDARGWLLTKAVAVPKRGEIPEHQRFYYLELLRRAGIIDALPDTPEIRLAGLDLARAAGQALFSQAELGRDVIGVSPGAAYGNAKRLIPEHFVESAAALSRQLEADVAIFGSRDEAALGDRVAAMLRDRGVRVWNFAGGTALRDFIDMAAACRVFLTNDSGAMHIASAAGVPTLAVFGATDHIATGPTGSLARVVREPVECSPCLLRECPIDHRCMTRVLPARVAAAARQLLEESAPAWTPEPKS